MILWGRILRERPIRCSFAWTFLSSHYLDSTPTPAHVALPQHLLTPAPEQPAHPYPACLLFTTSYTGPTNPFFDFHSGLQIWYTFIRNNLENSEKYQKGYKNHLQCQTWRQLLSPDTSFCIFFDTLTTTSYFIYFFSWNHAYSPVYKFYETDFMRVGMLSILFTAVQ